MKSQQESFSCGKHKLSLYAWLTVSAMLLFPVMAMAQQYTLTDPGSTATVTLSGADAGMNYWTVDADPGVNQLAQQWFYYSINGQPVQAINQLGTATVEPGSDNNILNLTYANAQLSINVQYTLEGGGVGSGNADIYEAIAIDNLSGTPINNVQFYQYSNFNLLQNNENTVNVYPDGQGGFYFAQQTAGSTALGEGIINPDANYAEAGTAAQVLSDILSGNNLTGPMHAGPGDVAWGFEWVDPTLYPEADGDEFDIEKDKSLSISSVPEPSTIALIALGMGALGLTRRRHS